MLKVSVIIVAYNARKIIKDCLDSVYAQSFTDFEVIIVDNGSRDGTAEFIRTNFPQAKLIENSNNLGFSLANNQGIEASQGEFILTLNSDVILEDDFITELIKTAQELPNYIGMFNPKILKLDKRTVDSTGLILTKTRRFYNRGAGQTDLGQYEDKRDIFGPCAAAALYRKNMLEDIKINKEYFDNNFFFLVEDVDLAWRANLKKWRGYFVPGSVCYHSGNSIGLNKKMRQFLSFRNRYFMMIKNERFFDLVKDLKPILAYDVLRFFYLMATNWLIFKALFEIIILYPKMLKKRVSGIN